MAKYDMPKPPPRRLTETEFIVMTSAAHMPRSVRHPYKNVALCEVLKGVKPKMISERAIGMVRIVAYYPRKFVGKTEKCAFSVCLRKAQFDAAKLNSEK